MASTARSDDDKEEYFDSTEDLDKKVIQLAEWIKESKHMIAFTGAGISTSAGVPDFRSGMDTKVATGPGKWELRAHGASRPTKHRVVMPTKAIPTATHMMIVKLHQEGVLKAVISQNTDGLHRRSGLPKTSLLEVHGNSNVEKCTKCKREYLRDFRVVTRGPGLKKHETGRLCDDPKCRGKLKDTIINFGQNLPQAVLDKSFEHAERADLCLAMGSSLTVTPAADIPETVGTGGRRLVVVNLQTTPLDYTCKLRIFAKCDDVSKMLMSKLGLEIPEFRLRRKVVIGAVTGPGRTKVFVEGRDLESLPFAFLKSVEFKTRGQVLGKVVFNPGTPFQCMLPEQTKRVVVTLEFQAHYGEPPLDIPVSITSRRDTELVVSLEYNPCTREWRVQRSDIEDEEAKLTAQLQATSL